MSIATYLDYNATAPLRPEAAAAIGRALEVCGNPSSVHRFGRQARRLIEEAREDVAALVGARPSQVVFTSGGTEANDLALNGTGRARVLVSAVEHDSIRQARAGAMLLPVDGDGLVDLGALEELLGADPAPALVSVMLANNETGVLQPLGRVVEIAHGAGALVHTDAVQAPGRVKVDFRGLGVDLMSVSAHKLGGPQGVGALIVADGVELTRRLGGGGQERGRRAGTENLAGIAGFAAAGTAAAAELAGIERVASLRDGLESRALRAVPEARIYGKAAPRLPNTSCIGVAGAAAETLVIALDLAGVAVSAGAACSSGKVRASHVLGAMGVAADEAGSAIRVSLGWRSLALDIERFIEAWGAFHARNRTKLAAA
ncbi:MAG: cysteine desulfurase [Proteobacteria bacterium]|nr:cysteine desulfurase [Pseudomonadota bacterium]MBI3496670.1 cysteine desulfurase [Pseudomonadota bacterium]